MVLPDERLAPADDVHGDGHIKRSTPAGAGGTSRKNYTLTSGGHGSAGTPALALGHTARTHAASTAELPIREPSSGPHGSLHVSDRSPPPPANVKSLRRKKGRTGNTVEQTGTEAVSKPVAASGPGVAKNGRRRRLHLKVAKEGSVSVCELRSRPCRLPRPASVAALAPSELVTVSADRRRTSHGGR